MNTAPNTAADFAALVAEARSKGEAPIAAAIPLSAIRAETDGKRFRIVATTSEGTTKRL